MWELSLSDLYNPPRTPALNVGRSFGADFCDQVWKVFLLPGAVCWDEISDCSAQSVGAGEGLGAAFVGWHKAQGGFVNLSALPLFPLVAACLINLRDLTPSLYETT